MHPRTIIVPIDFSDVSRAALQVALRLAGDGATLYLLHIERGIDAELRRNPAPDIGESGVGELIDIDEGALMRAAGIERRRLLDAGVSVADVTLRARIAGGEVVPLMLSMIEELNADLVVTGTHGRHGVMDQLRGSDSEQLVSRAPCSVFVVKPEGFPYLRD